MFLFKNNVNIYYKGNICIIFIACKYIPLWGTVEDEEDMSKESPMFTNSFATISRLWAAMCNSFNLFLADFVARPRRVLGGGIGGTLFSSFSFTLQPRTSSKLLGVSAFELKLSPVEFREGDSGGVLKSSKAELFDLIVLTI